MRRHCFAVVILGMGIAAHAVEPVNSVPVASPSQLPARSAKFVAGGLARPEAQPLVLTIVPNRAANTTTLALRKRLNGSVSALTAGSETKKGGEWAPHGNRLLDNGRPSLPPILRFQSKGQGLDIRPGRHSMSLQWSKTFH